MTFATPDTTISSILSCTRKQVFVRFVVVCAPDSPQKSAEGRFLWLALFTAAVAVAATLWFFPDHRSRQLLRTTFALASCAALVAVPIGVMIAWLVVRTNLPWRAPIAAAVLFALLLPLFMHAAVWEAGFGRLGWFSQLRGTMGQPPPLTGFRGAVWVHALAAIPWAALLAGAQLKISAPDVEEAARLDGSLWNVFWHVTMAQIGPATLLAALWIFVWVAGEMTVTDLFGVRTFAEEVYIGFAIDTIGSETPVTPSFAAGSALIIAMLLAALLLCRLFLPLVEGSQHRRPAVLALGRLRWPAFGIAVAVVCLLIVIPLGNLIFKAGMETKAAAPGQPTPQISWSAAKVVRLTAQSPWQYRREFGWSLAIAQLGSVCALLMATPLAFWANRSRLAAMMALLTTAVCLALPGPVVGLGIIRFFSTLPGETSAYVYSRTIFAPVLAVAIKCFPLTIGIVWSGLRRTEREMFETARLAGASSWQQLVKIALPTRGSLFVCAFLASFIFNLGDLAASILVVPPGVSTLAIRIFGLIHYGVEDRLAALCLATMGFLLLLGLVVAWAFWTWRERVE